MVVGDVPPAALFAALQPVVDSVAAKVVGCQLCFAMSLCLVSLSLSVSRCFNLSFFTVFLCALSQTALSPPVQPKSTTFTRPWMVPVPPLTTSSTIEVHFPSDDETAGDVKIAWRGPDWCVFAVICALPADAFFVHGGAIGVLGGH